MDYIVRNKKLLLLPSYKSDKSNISNYLHHLRAGIDLFLGYFTFLFKSNPVVKNLGLILDEKLSNLLSHRQG